MLRGTKRGGFIIATFLATLGVPAQEPDPAAIAGRLRAAEAQLAAEPDPGALLAAWPAVAADLVALASHHRAGRVSAEQARAWSQPAGWTHLQAVWLPLYGGTGAPASVDALWRDTGVHPATNLLSFLTALEIVAPRADGSIALAAPFAAVRGNLLPALRELDPGAAPPDEALVASRLRAAIAWEALPRLARGLEVTGNYFHVIARAEVPAAPAHAPLVTAFRDAATAGPDAYAVKWRTHGYLLSQFERIARREQAADLAPAFSFLWPYYLLLCHAGAPITPFRPAEHGGEGPRLFHFADPPQEDQPLQNLFSRESHLLQVTVLQGLLGRSEAAAYDPGRHMFMVPYDALASGDRWQIRSRRFGYLGYLDAFATRDYPFILRGYAVEEAAP